MLMKTKKNDLEYYNLNADKWWQEGEVLNLSNYLNESRFKFFSQYIHDWKGLQVLDIGCGGGLACEFLAKQEAIVYGIDISCNSIKIAQEHAHQNQLMINYYCGTAENLPFEANQFDVILCCDVLEHINNWQKVIAEAHRVLKPKGIFLFDTINQTFKSKLIMIWLLESILRRLPQGMHDWSKFIKLEEMYSIMQESGFREILIKGFDMTGGTSFETLKKLLFNTLTNQTITNNSVPFEIFINDDTSVWYIGKAVNA
jgi:2-polyprenyl-6-hydroxyphenyl methylase / 3-demethylubiquinone-9 3-methyltransferase